MASNNIYVQGSYIDVHDNEVVNLSLDGAEVKVDGRAVPSKDGHEEAASGEHECVPERLKSAEARSLMDSLVAAGLLTDGWQPIGLSGTERALVAKAVCERLKINEVWQVFGRLWGEKPETLRSYLNKALEQKKSLQFQDRLKNIF